MAKYIEREAFEKLPEVAEILNEEKSHFNGDFYNLPFNSCAESFINGAWYGFQEAKKLEGCVVVPERTGGFYIQDLRNPIGNCMKFWYKSGYGTKHKNFFWCATYEEAQEYAGGCDWFKIWYAPYIDTLIEHTVDMQHADRIREEAMLEAARGGK
ncbi:hypothetical protein [Acinetobacter sp. 102]|uniref:hypothetical protein n=1 Tax=Acinetobacter sp. 102 TaxID=3098766 RepID=UPI003008B9C4